MTDTTGTISQTAAEMEELVIDWFDYLFTTLVFPNMGKTTSDGVTLDLSWWFQKFHRQTQA